MLPEYAVEALALVALAALFSFAKSKASVVLSAGQKGYRYGSSLWFVEAGIYVALASRLIFTSLRVANGMSDRYKEVLVDIQGASSRVSGLHRSWLSPALGDRLMDLKDAQYHEFRDSLPLLSIVIGLYLTGSFFVRRGCQEYKRRS